MDAENAKSEFKSAPILTVSDPLGILGNLEHGEPVTMEDGVLRPVNSQKKKKLLADVTHVEAQLGRLAKTCRDIRAEVLSLTVEG